MKNNNTITITEAKNYLRYAALADSVELTKRKARAIVGASGGAVRVGDIVISVKRETQGADSIDTARLRKENPALYAQLLQDYGKAGTVRAGACSVAKIAKEAEA